jgi:hypothetical protein
MCVTIPHGLPSVKGRHSIFIWVCQIGSLGPARNGILCVAGNMSPSKFDTQFVTSWKIDTEDVDFFDPRESPLFLSSVPGEMAILLPPSPLVPNRRATDLPPDALLVSSVDAPPIPVRLPRGRRRRTKGGRCSTSAILAPRISRGGLRDWWGGRGLGGGGVCVASQTTNHIMKTISVRAFK